MWRCKTCGEEVDDNFEVCWNCSNKRTALDDQPGTAGSLRDRGDSSVSSVTPERGSLSRRYFDAYRIASVIDWYGKAIKFIGMLLCAFVVLLGGAVVVLEKMPETLKIAGFVVTCVTALIVLTTFYVVGVLVAAQGQILKATLDSAVNTSPFLDDELRAKIMSV